MKMTRKAALQVAAPALLAFVVLNAYLAIAEMERTISLRQQGFRHRAFMLVDTNEGKEYMDGARGLVSSLSSAESSSFARFNAERNARLSKALSGTRKQRHK